MSKESERSRLRSGRRATAKAIRVVVLARVEADERCDFEGTRKRGQEGLTSTSQLESQDSFFTRAD